MHSKYVVFNYQYHVKSSQEKLNKSISHSPICVYLSLRENVGRAIILQSTLMHRAFIQIARRRGDSISGGTALPQMIT